MSQWPNGVSPAAAMGPARRRPEACLRFRPEFIGLIHETQRGMLVSIARRFTYSLDVWRHIGPKLRMELIRVAWNHDRWSRCQPPPPQISSDTEDRDTQQHDDAHRPACSACRRAATCTIIVPFELLRLGGRPRSFGPWFLRQFSVSLRDCPRPTSGHTARDLHFSFLEPLGCGSYLLMIRMDQKINKMK